MQAAECTRENSFLRYDPRRLQAFNQGGFTADQRTLAQQNLDKASAMLIKDIRDGKHDHTIGLSEKLIRGGFDGIKFRLVDSLPDASAQAIYREVSMFGLKNVGIADVTIDVTIASALTLGGAVESVGHEFGHLSYSNRQLSNVVEPGQRHSPRELDAIDIGERVRSYYGL